MSQISPAINNNPYIKFIDRYMCRIVHNPIITSSLLIIAICAIQCNQLYYLFTAKYNQPDFIFMEDYMFDIVSNALNILFVLRFQTKSSAPINVAWEAVLFVLQNIGCYNLLFNYEYSILFNYEIKTSLKVCLITQIVFPYLILVINLIDYKNLTPSVFLSDCNSNYLPIFISHSFLYINCNFPYFDSSPYEAILSNIPFIYKVCSFSIKFYCIYGFILYEIALILYDVSDVANYDIFYDQKEDCYNSEKVDIFSTKDGLIRSATTLPSTLLSKVYNNWKNMFLIVSCTLVIIFDFVFIYIAN
ncbi:uncharacterized protein RJT20DRAFT_57258 [Scheffersomyces xylosifermentans]|uniref:uncharacterized protein n=1 Tax=Scheffersomyces xylosifermentans TaxID=1304137 RepID=UPI00315CB58F